MKYLLIRKYKGQDLLYWYPKKRYQIAGEWVKCPLRPVKVNSIAEAESLNKQLLEWRKGYEPLVQGTVNWLIAEYKQDERFLRLAPSTQKLYSHYFPEIERIFDGIPADKVTRQHTRAFYHKFKATKRKAAQLVMQGHLIYAFGMDIGVVTSNPFDSLRVAKGKPREAIWTPDMLSHAKEAAFTLKMPSIALAIQLGIDTGQRPSDLRLLTWNRYNGKTIKLRQTKTKVWVEVPVMKELRKMLDGTERDSPVILISNIGKPYSKDMLCRRIREVLSHAGIGSDIQFRDLRRTAVVRLAENGCEIPEICAITGHTLTDATEILETYLPRNSKMAANAIAKLEKLKER